MGVSVSFCFAGFSFSMIRSKLSMNLCVAATGALSTGSCEWKRCQEELPHVRGQGQKPGGPKPEGRWPRGVTPRLRSGAAAESARLRRHRNGREELPCVRGKGLQPRGATPCPRPGAVAERSHPAREARGGSQKEQPHPRGQRWRLGGATPRPRSGGCAGAGRPRGAIPRWRSGRAAVSRYPHPR